MDAPSRPLPYGVLSAAALVAAFIISAATAHEAGGVACGALTSAAFSLAAYFAGRAGREAAAKKLFWLGVLAGAAVAVYGVLTSPYAARARARAAQPAGADAPATKDAAH